TGAVRLWHVTAERRRLIARFAVAVAVSAAIWLALVTLDRPTLPRYIDVIGWPSYYDYNFLPLFWDYRLAVYLVPTLAIVLYAALARWGPLRRTAPRPKSAIVLVDAADPGAAGGSGPGEAAHAGWLRWSMIPRTGVPATVVIVAAAAGAGHYGP